MISKFLERAGVSSEEEFYAKYPNEEDFFNEYPEMAMGGDPQQGMYPGVMPQYGFGQSPYGAPMANPYFDNPDMEWGDPSDVDRFQMPENSINQSTPEQQAEIVQPSNKKLSIKDYLKAGTDRLQQTSDKFMAQYNDPASAINILGYAGSLADKSASRAKTKKMEQFYRNQFNSDNQFATVPGSLSGSRGDYNTTGSAYGMFRPDEMGAKSPYGMAEGGNVPDDGTKPIRKVQLAPVQVQDFFSPAAFIDGKLMVEKRDGSIGHWGNDISDNMPQYMLPPQIPMGSTDHNGRQSGQFYQGAPNADQKIQAIRQRLMQQAAANPMKRYRKGGEYQVTQDELAQLIASGADIEFI